MTKQKPDNQKPAENIKPEKTIHETYAVIDNIHGDLNALLCAIPDNISDGMEKRITGIKNSVNRLRDSIVSRLNRLGKKAVATDKKRELLIRIEERAKKLKAQLGE